MMERLSDFTESLSTYSGRDRVLRLVSYTSRMLSDLPGVSKSQAKALSTVSTRFAETRTVLRLFDDLPMLKCTWAYGFGETEPDAILRVLGVINNVFDQLYYPFDHVGWLLDHGIVRWEGANSTLWHGASTLFWALSLYTHVAKAVRYLAITSAKRRAVLKDSTKTKEQKSFELDELERRRWFYVLSIVQASCDLTNAINWLPVPILWSGTLRNRTIGALGVAASLIGLYKMRNLA